MVLWCPCISEQRARGAARAAPSVKCLLSENRCPPSTPFSGHACPLSTSTLRAPALRALMWPERSTSVPSGQQHSGHACSLRALMHGSPGADVVGAFYEQRAMLQCGGSSVSAEMS